MRGHEHANCTGGSDPPPPHHPVESSPNPNRSESATKSFASTPSCHRRAVGRLPITAMRRKTGSVQCPPYSTTEQRKGWSLMIFFARATRGRRRDGEGAARCPSCSQNAHDETVLVRCAQQRATSATPSKRGIRNWKALARVTGTSRRASGWAGENVVRSGRSISPIPRDITSLEGTRISFDTRNRGSTRPS